MELKIKLLEPTAVMPKFATSGSAGMDLTAIDRKAVHHSQWGTLMYYEYDTGISMAIPKGYVGLIFPRSSISNLNMSLANCVGVIDSDYRGPIKFRFKLTGDGMEKYNVGDRVGQLVIVKFEQPVLTQTDDLDETARGFGGYGSTGGF